MNVQQTDPLPFQSEVKHKATKKLDTSGQSISSVPPINLTLKITPKIIETLALGENETECVHVLSIEWKYQIDDGPGTSRCPDDPGQYFIKH